MGLFNFEGVDTGGDQYLGRKIQQRLKPLREEKLEIVKTKLGIEKISRPSIETCDISDTDSIIRFLARENLDCAFNCEPDTPPSRVLELCMIITGAIPSGTLTGTHIILHMSLYSLEDFFWYLSRPNTLQKFDICLETHTIYFK